MNIRYRFRNKKFFRIVIGIAILAVVVFVVSRVFTQTPSPTSEVAAFSTQTQDVNREFSFPIKESEDVEVSRIKIVAEKIETLDEIVVKGQKAKAVSGRMFFIVYLKIVNDFNKSVEINTRDYFRLAIEGRDSELLAPDIHNDPVEVQAISTKYTRIGFPVNTSDKSFTLQVGEINGDKEKIEIKLN